MTPKVPKDSDSDSDQEEESKGNTSFEENTFNTQKSTSTGSKR